MKIAVISDIHANLVALKAVLEDVRDENCDTVFCLGDIVLAGPQPKETIDFVKSQNWNIVQGNTDKMIADYGIEVLQMLKENFPVIANAVVDDMNILDESDVEYLKGLPPALEMNVEGIKILLVHGSPRYNNEDILPNMQISDIEEIIAPTDADLVLCGHTHVPCGYQTNSKQTVVNVGSVGRPMTENPLACYVILDLNQGIFTVKHKFIDYDRQMAAEFIRDRNFDGADKLAELLINPVVRHV